MADECANESPWVTSIRNAYAIHNVTIRRPELPFWLVRWDGARDIEWIDLTDPRQGLKPFHFEIHFGKRSARDQHYRDAMLAASRQATPVARELFGLWDLFHALPPDAERQNFLYLGQFYRQAPNWDAISAQWSALSGQDPASANPDFVQFVRMALALPVVGEDLLPALADFAQEYGRLLTGKDDGPEFHRRVDTLNRDAFTELWPIEDWIGSAISPDKFHLTPWKLEGKLTDWMKEGMGISRLPTTVMSLMPLDSRSEALDPVQTLVRNAQIQRACLAKVRTMPETAACRLQDYGVSVITSTRPKRGAAESRLELRERAQELSTFVKDEFGVRSAVGIGGSLPPGSGLHQSYRESVRALHMCVQLNEAILTHDEHESASTVVYADLQKAMSALQDALTRESNTEIKLASDRYVQRVLAYGDERIEVVRGQFLATLFQLFRDIERRHPINSDSRDHFVSDLSAPVERAQSLYRLIEAFKGSLQRLSYASSRTLQGPKVMRLEVTLQYLQDNFAERLPLPDVARKAGFSVPVFSRIIKQTTGSSYLAYLRTLRVAHAKKLLTTSRLTTEEVAHACGFQSQHHLIRSFKKLVNETPGAYRKGHSQG
jgi:AraC-like DNA-binding protein